MDPSARYEFCQSVNLLRLLFELRLLRLNLLLLLVDLRLLFIDGVNEDDAHVGIFHAFDFAFIILVGKQRFHLGDLLRD